MAKLNRESKLREKRAEKQARKAARKLTTESDAEQAVFPSEQLDLDPAMPDDAQLASPTAASRTDQQ